MKKSTKEFLCSALFMICTVFAALVLGILVGLGIFKVYESFRPTEAAQEEETTVEVYKAVREEIAVYQALEEYTEGEGEPPAWWNPDEPMAAEWEDESCNELTTNLQQTCNKLATNLQSDTVDYKAQCVIDGGCPDWNLDTTLWGWDNHNMEAWEMDLFARIAYLEFWGCSHECCEAGIDSILNLWDMGEYGDTMGELLSAQYAPGYYVYSPYAYVWDWTYDQAGLTEIRAMCEERFMSGPTWIASYFRLWYYHEWAVPAYQIDNVYFSVPKWRQYD